MKKNNWKDIAELIGITAIVASLIFVGLQMKQSQEIAVADQYQARADAALEFYLGRMQSERALATTARDIADKVASGRAPDAIRRSLESEGPEAVAQRHLEYRANITMFDNYHFQYERGFLTEGAWQGFRVRLKAMFAKDINAALYRQMESQFRPSFHAECSRILAEIKNELEGQ